MILRKAEKGEEQLCYRFIEDARAYQRSLGFVQWTSDYPTLETVTDDIKIGTGYVFAEGEVPIGYCCILTDGEPVYSDIEGEWKSDRRYAVVHRMAFASEHRGSGLSSAAFDSLKKFCEQLGINAMRADTHADNKVMQHILLREGFEYCGLVSYYGSPRLAYERDW